MNNTNAAGTVESNKGEMVVNLSSVEDIVERKLNDITTLLYNSAADKSRLYDEVISVIEASLIRISLKKCKNVKSAAAAYLGISRNTFQKKMVQLGIEERKR